VNYPALKGRGFVKGSSHQAIITKIQSGLLDTVTEWEEIDPDSKGFRLEST
jgi:hypothetical protein